MSDTKKKAVRLEILLAYLHKLYTKENKEAFAARCGTSIGNINQIAYGLRGCNAETAIRIDKASSGEVKFNDLCPDIDWAYVAAECEKRNLAA